jgi:hypothetical protein
VAKKITISPSQPKLDLVYTLINNNSDRVNLWFGIELGWGIAWREDEKNFCYIKNSEAKNKEAVVMGNAAKCSEFGINDDYLKLDINFKLDRPTPLWRFPVYTVSLSEAGFEKVQQSLVLFPNWKITLEPQERWEVKIANSFISLK